MALCQFMLGLICFIDDTIMTIVETMLASMTITDIPLAPISIIETILVFMTIVKLY